MTNTNETMSSVLEDLSEVFSATNDSLNEWTGAGTLQFPVLLAMMATKLNWDDKQMREADPLVRYFVRKHPDWHVTRGAHGGIMRITDKQKKEASKASKASAKDQLKAQIEAKAATTAAPVTSVVTAVVTPVAAPVMPVAASVMPTVSSVDLDDSDNEESDLDDLEESDLDDFNVTGEVVGF
jgi:hypothetical protein